MIIFASGLSVSHAGDCAFALSYSNTFASIGALSEKPYAALRYVAEESVGLVADGALEGQGAKTQSAPVRLTLEPSGQSLASWVQACCDEVGDGDTSGVVCVGNWVSITTIRAVPHSPARAIKGRDERIKKMLGYPQYSTRIVSKPVVYQPWGHCL